MRFVSWLFALLLMTTVPLAAQTGNQLLIVSDQSGNREIYLINEDGSGLQQLTFDAAEDLEPAWSPDRRQIAFASNRTGNFAIYITNADGTGVRRVTDDLMGSYITSPVWSPDGGRLAFVSNVSGVNQIHRIRLNGSDFQRLTQTSDESVDPSWSPDGQTIAYASNGSGNFEIYVMNANNGGNARAITADASVDSDSPSWSPDGSEIAFAANSGGRGEIYIMPPSGNDIRLLISVLGAFVSAPTWSPDGSEIAFGVFTDGAQTVQVVDSDGFSARQLALAGGEVLSPAWSSAPLRAAEPQFTAISYALVVTRYGDTLNMRLEPTLDADVIEALPYGTPVSIIEGPRSGDGYHWWRVVSPTGVTGWSVEAADNVQTLVFSGQMPESNQPFEDTIRYEPRFSYGERAELMGQTNVWTRPDTTYGRSYQPVQNQTSVEIAGVPYANYDANARLTWWYFVRITGELIPIGWVPEERLE